MQNTDIVENSAQYESHNENMTGVAAMQLRGSSWLVTGAGQSS